MPSPRERGFTLIEILIVIAVIAVLAAIIFPVLHSARDKARASTCAANLHQMSLAIDAYASDCDEMLPISYIASLTGPYRSWRQFAQPYIRNTDIYMCPAAQVSGAKLAELPPERRHGYAINALLSPPDLRAVGGSHGTPLGLAQIESPSTTILLCDAGYSNLPVALDYSRCLSLGMQEQLLPSRRHSGGSNFCFADGHVKRLTEPATRTPDGLWSPD